MTARDRIVLIVISAFAIVGAAWMLVVAPVREQASKLEAQVTSAQALLTTAEGQLSGARAAQAQYAAAYTSVVNLGKAVPASQEVPSLIYQISQASNLKRVDFLSIVSGSGSAPSSTGASTLGASASAGFAQMPFTFVFNGTFFDLEHMFQQLNGFTKRTASGTLQVSGRLLTVQSVKLAPIVAASAESHKGASELTGTITATAYVLPASQGLAPGVTPGSPPGASTAIATTTTRSVGSPVAPAIARVTP